MPEIATPANYFDLFEIARWWLCRWAPEYPCVNGAAQAADTCLRRGSVVLSWRGHSLRLTATQIV